MSLRNFFTSYFDSLSDLKTSFDFSNELRGKLIENRFLNSLKGKMKIPAVVLQIDNEKPSNTATPTRDGKYIMVKVRPLEIHEFLLPHPCEGKAGHQTWLRDEIIDMHPEALSDSLFFSSIPSVGAVVEIYYDQQGPQFHGKMRGLRFRSSQISSPAGYYNYNCLKDYATRPQGYFNNSSRKRQRQTIDPKTGAQWEYTSSQINTMKRHNGVPSDWDILYFNLKDFISKGNGSLLLHKKTARALDKAASRVNIEMTNKKIKIKSAYRDAHHNEKRGGKVKSQHLNGRAFDLVVTGWTKQERLQFLNILYEEGFRGFGLGAGVIHADTGPARHWGYKSGGDCNNLGTDGCGYFTDRNGNSEVIVPSEFPWKK